MPFHLTLRPKSSCGASGSGQIESVIVGARNDKQGDLFGVWGYCGTGESEGLLTCVIAGYQQAGRMVVEAGS